MKNQFLKEYIREVLSEKTSALDSETNLKNAINTVVQQSEDKIKLNLGDFGLQTIIKAEKAGGGNPEPKADIIIFTEEYPSGIGISMKAPNYDFIQNRMQTSALKTLLSEIGVNEQKQASIIDNLKEIVKDASLEKEENIKRQRDDFFKAIDGWGKNYTFPDPLWRELKGKDSSLKNELIKTGSWSEYRSSVKSKSIIPTVLVDIKELLNDKEYELLLKSVIAGNDRNPRKADGMLISLVPENINNKEDLQKYLDDIMDIDSALTYYKDKTAPPRIRMVYRSQIASRLSQTESRRFDNTKDAILEIPVSGDILKWYVSIVK